MKKVQYTIRNVPPVVDKALRRKALEEKKSLSQVLLEALSNEARLAVGPDGPFHDLDHLAGKWIEDPEFDAAIQAQDQVDEGIWE